jgi:NADH-quinone oxidoreductase subunit L
MMPHESPWVVTAPLVLLAIPSVVIGFMTIQPMLFGDFFKDAIFVDAEKHPAMAELAKMIHGPVARWPLHAFSTAPFWLALAGVALSYYMYMVNPALPAPSRRMLPVYTLLENKYYMDWFNENVMARARARWAPACGRAATRPSSTARWSMVPGSGGLGRRRRCAGSSPATCTTTPGDDLGVFVLMTYFVWLNK